MKKKYIDGSSYAHEWVHAYASNQHYDRELNAYWSCLHFYEIKGHIPVDYDDSNLPLIENGSKALFYLPMEKHYCICCVFNSKDEIVEWYIDITAENALDKDGRVYYLDAYLDIAISPTGSYRLLDGDELEEAYQRGHITQKNVRLAYEAVQYIIEHILPNKTFLVKDFKNQLKHFQKQHN